MIDKTRLCFRNGRLVYALVDQSDDVCGVQNHINEWDKANQEVCGSKHHMSTQSEYNRMMRSVVDAAHIEAKEYLDPFPDHLWDKGVPTLSFSDRLRQVFSNIYADR